MKKGLLIAAMALFGLSNAQTEKGTWMLSGTSTIGFNSLSISVKEGNKSENSPSVSLFAVTPSAAYFVQDNLAIGADLGVLSASVGESKDKVSMTAFTIMPTAKYYFATASKVHPYLGAGIGYSSIKVTMPDFWSEGTTSETVDGFSWKANGGIALFVAENVAFDLGLGYNRFTNSETVEGTTYKTSFGNFGVNAGVSVFLK